MADLKISELPVATTPLAGTEKAEIVQGGVNKQVDVSEFGAGGSFVPLTLTANTTILTSGFYLRLQGTGVQIPRLVLDAPNNIRKTIAYRTGDAARWEIHMEDNETGSNAGANLHFERFDDAGAFIDAPFIITRSTGIATHKGLATAATVITDAASMDIAQPTNTLTTSSATRTFTISFTGDDITLEITLNTTASTLTFPATSLCVSEGTPSGDNTCALAGASGDKYILAIKKIGSAYYVVAKNFGQ